MIIRSFLRRKSLHPNRFSSLQPANRVYFSWNVQNFVIKTVSPHQVQKAHFIKNALPRNTFVRLPIDEIEQTAD